jgi:hypothetical protein
MVMHILNSEKFEVKTFQIVTKKRNKMKEKCRKLNFKKLQNEEKPVVSTLTLSKSTAFIIVP